MKTALIQTDLVWENPIENRNVLKQKINKIEDDIDLIILPEMFTTGFTMNPKPFAETMNGETVLWLKVLATDKNCAIMGSLIIIENNNFYNRLVFVFPDGKMEYYDKKNLFTPAKEDEFYTAGNEKRIVKYKGFRICLLVCYDLRFPVFCANDVNYDLLIFVANWPEIRINAWNILLKARAVENICYTIGVNRIGYDNNNIYHNGNSQVVDKWGNYILEPQEMEGTFIVNLEKKN
jgi:predicted amidohydrolase